MVYICPWCFYPALLFGLTSPNNTLLKVCVDGFFGNGPISRLSLVASLIKEDNIPKSKLAKSDTTPLVSDRSESVTSILSHNERSDFRLLIKIGTLIRKLSSVSDNVEIASLVMSLSINASKEDITLWVRFVNLSSRAWRSSTWARLGFGEWVFWSARISNDDPIAYIVSGVSWTASGCVSENVGESITRGLMTLSSLCRSFFTKR